MFIKYLESLTSVLFLDEFNLWTVAKNGGVGFFSSPTPYTKDTQQRRSGFKPIYRNIHTEALCVLCNSDPVPA
jgi:hypothetical protein